MSIENQGGGVTTNDQGAFLLEVKEKGSYNLVISMVGFEKISRPIKLTSVNQSLDLGNIKMTETTQSLEEVVVNEQSFSSEMSEQAIIINAIDAAALQAQTQDVSQVLDKIQGVKIRQSGGLGSQINITLNGLTGNAVRFYYDGIPIEYLGEGFSLNRLAISTVERIEVYKGVMPGDIGTDALGGGINVAPKVTPRDNLDVSYEFGSFNTHRAAASYTKNFKDHWNINVNANYSYSDNDYKMDVENILRDGNLVTGVENIRVRRFHDAFSAFLAQANLGYYNEDKQLNFRLSLSTTAGSKEIQHGVRVGTIPFGEAEFKEQGTNFIFKIDKGFGDSWQLRYSASPKGIVPTRTPCWISLLPAVVLKLKRKFNCL
ncbi:MAG: TonB-dependent receptor, partial [Bacteroidota bacterium]